MPSSSSAQAPSPAREKLYIVLPVASGPRNLESRSARVWHAKPHSHLICSMASSRLPNQHVQQSQSSRPKLRWNGISLCGARRRAVWSRSTRTQPRSLRPLRIMHHLRLLRYHGSQSLPGNPCCKCKRKPVPSIPAMVNGLWFRAFGNRRQLQ